MKKNIKAKSADSKVHLVFSTVNGKDPYQHLLWNIRTPRLEKRAQKLPKKNKMSPKRHRMTSGFSPAASNIRKQWSNQYS